MAGSIPWRGRWVPTCTLAACVAGPVDVPDDGRTDDTDAVAVDTDRADDTDVDGAWDDPYAWTGTGVPADPLGLELPDAWVPGDDLPLLSDAVDALADAATWRDHVLGQVRAARRRAGDGCAQGARAWRNGTWYDSVPQAFDAATAAPVVLVCGGAHSVDLLTVDDRIVAALDPADPPTLTPSAVGPVVGARGDAFLGLVDLVVTGGQGTVPAVAVSGTGRVVVLGSTFRGNATTGLSVQTPGPVLVAGSTFVGNHGETTAGARLVASTSVVFGNVFDANLSTGTGAGLSLEHGDGGAPEGVLVVARNRFSGNRASVRGGALEVGGTEESLQLVTAGNAVVDNLSAADGGGLVIGGRRAVWLSLHDLFADNTCARKGAGVFVRPAVRVDATLLDPIVVDNEGRSAVAVFPAETLEVAAVRFVGGVVAGNATGSPALDWCRQCGASGSGMAFGEGEAANTGGDASSCPSLGVGATWEVAWGTCDVQGP